MSKEVRYYHGGIKGLKRGDKILPPSITGKNTLLNYAKQLDENCVQREDRVYITTDKNMAQIYAATFPKGDVYRVIPNGLLEDDPDCLEKGLSFQCESATIKAVVKVG